MRTIAALRQLAYDPEAQYWLGVALQSDGQTAEAKSTLGALLAVEGAPAWLRPWCEVRLGELELAAGNKKEARSYFQATLKDAPVDDTQLRERAAAHLK